MLTDLYYALAFGHYPYETDVEYEKTATAIQYLVDCRMPEHKIEAMIERLSVWKRPYLEAQGFVLNDEYSQSLLEPDKFYYHPNLQLRSPLPTFNPMTGETKESPFYLEMQIYYTESDVVDFAYDKLKIPHELMDFKRDTGSVRYLLQKYSKVTMVEPIDFVLYLIEEASIQDRSYGTILDVAQFEVEVYDHIRRVVAEAKAKGADRIVWR